MNKLYSSFIPDFFNGLIMKNGIFLLFLGIIVSYESVSAIRTAVSSGNWEQTATWSGGVSPGCGDTVVIGSGINVQITTLLDFTACGNPLTIKVAGTLSFQTGKRLKLPCQSTIELNSGGQITAGSGGGNSNLIDICESTVWNTAQGNLTGPVLLSISPLPIELAYFAGKPGKDEIVISWITFAEKNNSFFTVLKSKDGKNFTELTQVAGGGTTPVMNSYTTTDKNPFEGVQYYRLRQTDYDGKSTLSGIIVIRYNSEVLAHIYPNPTRGDLFINLHPDMAGKMAQLVINKSNGRLHLRKEIKIIDSTQGIKLLQSNELLKPGSYVVSLNFKNESFSQLVIAK